MYSITLDPDQGLDPDPDPNSMFFEWIHNTAGNIIN